MALHNSFKQGPSQQQGTRLAAVPTTEDLTYALAQAGKNSKNPVVISWKNSKTSMVFWLSVTASSGGADAEWLLQKGEENAQPKDVWNHKTADISLIQSLVSAEEEMARKAGAKTASTSSPEEPNKQKNNIPGNAEWNATVSNPEAPIVLGGGFQAQPQRPSASSAPPPQWQSSEISGWNAPQPAPEQMGFADKPAQNPDNATDGAPSNPFAALKGTVEAPKPVNPFNALMSNQSLPQLPKQEMSSSNQTLPQQPKDFSSSNQTLPQQPKDFSSSNQTLPQQPKDFSSSNQTLPQLPEQERPGSSLPKDDPSVNPYDALTNSGAGIKQTPLPPKPPPAPPAPPPPPPAHAHPPSALMQHTQQAHSAHGHPMHGHPKVPDFAAMTSSGAFPVLQVSPDQALNPKSAPQANSNQNKTPFVINEVSSNSQHSQATNEKHASPSQPDKANTAPSAAPQQTSTKPLPLPVELDRAAVDNVFKSLSNPETGLLTHSSFLFFLVREFTRYQGNGEPFSLIIMELNVMISGSVGGKLPRPLPPRGVRAAAERICSITRPLDLLTHYDRSEYAILLPATSRQQSAEFAIGVGKALLSKPLLPDMEPKSLVVHMGVASFPEDTSHPGILLAAASEAKSTAQIAGKPIILFSET